MKAWALLLGLIHCLLAEHVTDAKRYDPSMVDPLMRRSSLDKNFMRFGRSSPAFTEEDEAEDGPDSSPDAETSKEENFLRSMRGKDNFIRFGRARNDNFMRFGKGKQDNFMRFGRARNDNFMRFGRGKQDNYMRFGRGKQDNFMRFGRGKQDNFMRFGKGKQDNFMRFGRGKQDNFMRFGRGKQDNFMRFGRDFTGLTNDLPNVFENSKDLDSEILRGSRGKQDNFMRFGKSLARDPDNDIAIAMRSGNSKDSNFIRFGRARQDNFMRFGKSDAEKNSLPLNEDSEELKDKSLEKPNYPFPLSDDFTREIKSKDLNLVRFGRQPPTKNDGFIRFGRNSPDQIEDGSQDIELIPQRLKRSVVKAYDSQEEIRPSKLHEESYDHVSLPFSTLPDELEEEYSTPVHQEDYLSRKRRSLATKSSTPSPFTEEDTSVDYISAKVRFDSPTEPEYQSSLISAGLPNVIVGPEFSLLPNLDPPSHMLKRGRLGDQNFLRLG